MGFFQFRSRFQNQPVAFKCPTDLVAKGPCCHAKPIAFSFARHSSVEPEYFGAFAHETKYLNKI